MKKFGISIYWYPTCDLLTNYHSQTPLLLRAMGVFTGHIPQVTMWQINKQDQKCLLALIPIQSILVEGKPFGPVTYQRNREL